MFEYCYDEFEGEVVEVPSWLVWVWVEDETRTTFHCSGSLNTLWIWLGALSLVLIKLD